MVGLGRGSGVEQIGQIVTGREAETNRAFGTLKFGTRLMTSIP